MVTVNLVATMPDGELERFLTIILDWDGARLEIDSKMAIKATTMKTREVDEILRRLNIVPPVIINYDIPDHNAN